MDFETIFFSFFFVTYKIVRFSQKKSQVFKLLLSLIRFKWFLVSTLVLIRHQIAHENIISHIHSNLKLEWKLYGKNDEKKL